MLSGVLSIRSEISLYVVSGGEDGKEEPRGLRKSILLGVTCEGPEHSPC